MTVARSARLALGALVVALLSVAANACTTEEASSGRPAQTTCVFFSTMCEPGICDGCTVGSLRKCPPSDREFTSPEACSTLSTDDDCRALAQGRKASTSNLSSTMYYYKDLRLLHGVTDCTDWFEHPEKATPEVICDGLCVPP